MKPNVALSTSLFALSSLVLAMEHARPDAQVAPRAPQYPPIIPQVRNSLPLGYSRRQGPSSDSASEISASETSTTTSESATSSSETTSTQPPPTSTTTTPPPSSTPASTPISTTRSTTTSPPPVSASVVTGSDGAVSTLTLTVTNSGTATSSSASPSETGDPNSGPGAKSIAGIAVAGSLAVIGIAGFIWWKLSKKRFSGLEDTDDNFKWPDLNENTAMQPLPGRAESVRGGRDGALDSSQSESTHAKPYYDNQSAISSAVDLSRGPVEHAPTASYYDNPPSQYPNYQHSAYAASDAASGYYDPYSGPVPEVFSPQTATGPNFAADAGRRSPGPNMAYDTSGYGPRAASPGPNAAYAPRSASPGPNVAYGGPRVASPGPNMAYGGPRSASPGPNAAYAPRSNSPGPNAAYAPRSNSPGPNAAYAAYGPRSNSPGPGAAYAAYGARSASPGPNYGYGGRTSPGPNNLGQQ